MKALVRAIIAALMLAMFKPSAATLYVSLESTNPVAPYSTWATAATNIQDAVDVAMAGDTVLVTNGVYATGARNIDLPVRNVPPYVRVGLSRVVITNAVRLTSLNGPMVTTLKGNRIINQEGLATSGLRCAFLGNGATLSGFTLTDGYGAAGGGALGGTLLNCRVIGNSAECGGGAYGSSLYNCVVSFNQFVGDKKTTFMRGGGVDGCMLYDCSVTGNRNTFGGGAFGSTLFNCMVAGNKALWGGGAFEGTLYNCMVVGNLAESGGGTHGGGLYNCTLTGNSASSGGGAFGGALFSSILYYNTAPDGANYFAGINLYGEEVSTLLNYCCTAPIPTNGIGNITGPPLFIDMAAGDFRLREDSPCIDAGTNLVGFSSTATNHTGDVELIAYTHDPIDILGNTRFIDGNGDGKVAWDIGAYEFNSFKPPRFSGPPQRTAEGWEFTITGPTNKWVGLQRTSDFTGWWDLQPPVFTGEEGVCHITDADTGPKVMFYRAMVVP